MGFDTSKSFNLFSRSFCYKYFVLFCTMLKVQATFSCISYICVFFVECNAIHLLSSSGGKNSKEVGNYESGLNGKATMNNTVKSALNSPSALNSIIPPKKIKKEAVSPVKDHKPAVNHEPMSPVKSHKTAIKKDVPTHPKRPVSSNFIIFTLNWTDINVDCVLAESFQMGIMVSQIYIDIKREDIREAICW